MNPWKRQTLRFLNAALTDGQKKSLLHVGFHLAREEFDEFAYRYSNSPDMKLGLHDFASRGVRFQTIIDVGAFEGTWSRLASIIWPEAKLFMVEPNALTSVSLQKLAEELHAQLFNELLGATDGLEVQFNVMGSGSSVLPERSALPRDIQRRHLRRLDSILQKIKSPALLKIDAQGYELEIIKGASGLLSAIEAVLLEISMIEINKGAPLLHDVLPFMKALGYVSYDILQIHRRPLDKALNQIDILFIRENSPLLADKRHFA